MRQWALAPNNTVLIGVAFTIIAVVTFVTSDWSDTGRSDIPIRVLAPLLGVCGIGLAVYGFVVGDDGARHRQAGS